MEFDCAYGDIEPVGDLFIGSVADHRMEDLPLPRAEACGTGNRPAFFEELLCPRHQTSDQCFLCWNEDGEIARFVPSHKALHGQQACDALHRAIEISARCSTELGYPRGFVAENERVEWFVMVVDIGYGLLCGRNGFRQRTQFLHNAPPLSYRDCPERSLFGLK